MGETLIVVVGMMFLFGAGFLAGTWRARSMKESPAEKFREPEQDSLYLTPDGKFYTAKHWMEENEREV